MSEMPAVLLHDRRRTTHVTYAWRRTIFVFDTNVYHHTPCSIPTESRSCAARIHSNMRSKSTAIVSGIRDAGRPAAEDVVGSATSGI